MNLQELKSQSINTLSSSSPSPQLDVEVLIQHFFGLNKTQQLLRRSEEVSPSALENFNSAVKARSTGLPVAYITGHKEFYGYDFIVSPSVLIPKPDTEILVENAVQLIKEKIDLNPNKIITVCDMCTGSGCIALSVLKTLYESENVPLEQLPKFTLVDISQNALEIAKQNTEKLLESDSLKARVRLIQSNLFEQLPQVFDVVLTNPPYIPSEMVTELLKDGRHEPRLALDGDITITGDKAPNNDGLEIIRNLIPQIMQHLVPQSGFFLMETGEYNMEGAKKLAQTAGFKDLEVFNDLSGQLRVLYGANRF